MDAQTSSDAIDRMFGAYSAGDLDGFAAGVTEDLHYEDNAGGPPLAGRAAFRDYVPGWFNACSDGKLVPTRKIIAGDEVALEMHFTGTHDRGPLYGVDPTGNAFELRFAITLRVKDGEVTELKAWFNRSRRCRQSDCSRSCPPDRRPPPLERAGIELRSTSMIQTNVATIRRKID